MPSKEVTDHSLAAIPRARLVVWSFSIPRYTASPTASARANLPPCPPSSSSPPPNGAGKTTFINRFLRQRAEAFRFVNPDAASLYR